MEEADACCHCGNWSSAHTPGCVPGLGGPGTERLSFTRGSAGSSGHSKAMLEPVSIPTSYEYLLCVKEQSWCGREQEMGQLLNPRSSACGRGCSFERGQAVARHSWWGPGGSACCGRTASRLLFPFQFITLANCVLLPLVREKTQQ